MAGELTATSIYTRRDSMTLTAVFYEAISQLQGR